MTLIIKIQVEDEDSKARMEEYINSLFSERSFGDLYALKQDKEKEYTFSTENEIIYLFARLGFEDLEGIEILEKRITSWA